MLAAQHKHHLEKIAKRCCTVRHTDTAYLLKAFRLRLLLLLLLLRLLYSYSDYGSDCDCADDDTTTASDKSEEPGTTSKVGTQQSQLQEAIGALTVMEPSTQNSN